MIAHNFGVGVEILIHYLLACAIAFVLMGATFAVSTRLNYYSVVDSVWAFSFAIIAVVFGIYAGNFDQHFVFYGLIILWSLRLSGYIFARLIHEYPKEDSRYVDLKRKWQKELAQKFAIFFALQGATIVLLATPIVIVAANPDGHVDAIAKIAVVLWLIGIVGEAIADVQLRAFKINPKHHGQVCDVGLWKLSRHPNYFFEWIIWCAFGVYALGAPYGILGLCAPVLMYILLNYVSGVPLAEAQSLKSKGELYEDYQRRTNQFFPWLPKAKK